MADFRWFIRNWDYFYIKDAPIHISWLSLDKSSISLTTVWQTEQLTATISPEWAVETKVVWSSSDETIATVSQTWLVTCVTPWECTITATCVGYSATCAITDKKYVDFLLIAWWWGWWYANNVNNSWWWGWAGWVIQCSNYLLDIWSYCIVIWAWGSSGTSSAGWNGGNSCFWDFIACWWWGWGFANTWCAWWSWWWAWFNLSYWSYAWGSWINWQWYAWWCSYQNAWWGWWWAWQAWWNWAGAGSYIWWSWWNWIQSDISWTMTWYAWWGTWWSYRNCDFGVSGCGQSCCGGWWIWGRYCYAWTWGAWRCWVFILRYPTACWYDITWWTCYTCNDYTIHCFTSNSTLTVN